MNAPLAWLAVCVSLGIWTRNLIQIPVLFSLLISICFIPISLVTIKNKTASILSICVTAFFIGCLILSINQFFPPYHLKNFSFQKPREVYLSGIVISEPKIVPGYYGGEKMNFIMESECLIEEGSKKNVCGKTSILIDDISSETMLEYGDKVLLKGFLSIPPRPGNPAQFNYAEYLNRRGMFSILRAKGQDAVILERNGGNRVFRMAFRIKKKIRDLIDASLPKDESDFINAVLLGLSGNMDFQIKDTFVKTGTMHLIAISGLNVGFLVFLAMIIFSAARVPRNLGVIVSIFLLIFYAILTGGTISVIRAVIMAIAVLFGALIAREISLWNSLGLAAVIILGIDPLSLFDVGFQLSFLSIIFILYLTPRFEELFSYDRSLSVLFMGRIKRYFLEAFFVSFSVWIGILPLVLFYYNIVTPVTVIANLLVVPLSFLIVASGIVFIASSFIIPPAAKVFAAATSFLCATLFSANDIFSKVFLSHVYLPKPRWHFIVLYYAFIMTVMERRRLKISSGKLLIAAFLIINVIVWKSALVPADERLKVTFLDVGHGDSAFIEFPRGGNMLIDGGNEDAGRNVILPFLRNKGVYLIDAVVLTHPDSDHCGGLITVMSELRVGRLFYGGAKSDSSVYKNLENLIAEKKTRATVLKRGDSIEGACGVNLFCLNPPDEFLYGEDVSENDRSVLINMKYKKISMFFCGDIGEKAMSEVMTYRPNTRASLLTLPHHGEKLTLAGESFINGLFPEYAVISQGAAANEILRSERIEEVLAAKGMRVFRTNRDGAIFAETDGHTLSVNSFASANLGRCNLK
ncbi:MAG: DNA internalization-related competence protein ComEC/Rec2 [Candidatus Omnitrophota bacterium]